MGRYITQRSTWVILVLLGVSAITFALLHLTPGDPAQILLGPIATPQELDHLRRELGLDRPLAIQYAIWLDHVARGDLGRSITLHRPVLGELLLRFRGTLILTAGAIIVAFWPGMILIIVFSVRLGWLPGTGMSSPSGPGTAGDVLTHLILPAVTLGMLP